MYCTIIADTLTTIGDKNIIAYFLSRYRKNVANIVFYYINYIVQAPLQDILYMYMWIN